MNQKEVEKIKEDICDYYCKWPEKCRTQEQLDKYCEGCPLNNLRERSLSNG